jgi:hypothetical protein
LTPGRLGPGLSKGASVRVLDLPCLSEDVRTGVGDVLGELEATSEWFLENRMKASGVHGLESIAVDVAIESQVARAATPP